MKKTAKKPKTHTLRKGIILVLVAVAILFFISVYVRATNSKISQIAEEQSFKNSLQLDIFK